MTEKKKSLLDSLEDSITSQQFAFEKTFFSQTEFEEISSS